MIESRIPYAVFRILHKAKNTFSRILNTEYSIQSLRARGFTLIELLVVIAIIGVLASIVLASLDSTRKKGRDAKRLSDIKQLQLALELYYDNYNEFPDGDGATGGLTAAQLETP